MRAHLDFLKKRERKGGVEVKKKVSERGVQCNSVVWKERARSVGGAYVGIETGGEAAQAQK